jgi:single-strand DNA-binding protein
MADVNVVHLIGRLTRDAELKYTPSGTALCKFSLAVSTHMGHGDDKKEETSFINVSVWGKPAEVAATLKKGAPAYVQGRIKVYNYEDKSGEKRLGVEVVCERFQFLAPPERKEDKAQNASSW